MEEDEPGTVNIGNGIRENPKKNRKISDSTSEDTLITLTTERVCKECGKGFHSWKALFGHMKCHSHKEKVSNSLVEHQDSVTNNNASSSHNQNLGLDTQSDNDATVPSRRRSRRSKRKRTSYMADANTNPSTFSLSQDEKEQEEVAMSLIMLSRDLSPWSGVNSVVHFSHDITPYFQPSSEITKVINQSETKLEFGNCVSGNLNSKGKSSKSSATECNKSKRGKKCELDYVPALENSEGNRVNGTESNLSKYTITNKCSSIKTKFFDSKLKSKPLKNWEDKPSEAAEFSKNTHKRGKFECTTCNKIFPSYQALGGHRAATHKRKKNYFASKNESTESNIDPTTRSMFMKNSDIEYLVEAEMDIGYDNEVTDTVNESKKSKVHKCPICLKIYQSGQALGGHKRSHLVSGYESTKNFEDVVVEEPLEEITQEEENNHK